MYLEICLRVVYNSWHGVIMINGPILGFSKNVGKTLFHRTFLSRGVNYFISVTKTATCYRSRVKTNKKVLKHTARPLYK